jgi:hypothetical protein
VTTPGLFAFGEKETSPEGLLWGLATSAKQMSVCPLFVSLATSLQPSMVTLKIQTQLYAHWGCISRYYARQNFKICAETLWNLGLKHRKIFKIMHDGLTNQKIKILAHRIHGAFKTTQITISKYHLNVEH